MSKNRLREAYVNNSRQDAVYNMRTSALDPIDLFTQLKQQEENPTTGEVNSTTVCASVQLQRPLKKRKT
jgi:hypothetical protein